MAKPIVDGIEKDLEGEADVIRLNILKKTGREALMMYHVRAIPTLIVLDGCGEVAGKYVGIPRSGKVIETVRALPACEPDASAN